MKKRIAIIVLSVFILGILIGSGTEKYYEGFQQFVKTVNIVKEMYVRDVPPQYLFYLAINGMLNELDPHSVLLEKKDLEEFNIQTMGEFGGIGIQIGLVDKVLTVIAPIEGTPAYRLGLRPGDKIVKIEGESTKGYTLNKAVSILRGKPGTKVNITVLRDGEEIDYTITRDVIHIKDVPYAGIIDGDIGYVRLLSFSASSSQEVESACDSLLKKGAKGIILDLRGNPGGLLSAACDIAGLFLPKNKLIVFTDGKNPVTKKSYYSEKSKTYDVPVIVLVDRGSASASEIVSGAIQDWDRGLIIGDTTFGKGSVQNMFKLTDDSAVKITVARYFTPSGRCIDRELKDYERNQKIFERDYLNMDVLVNNEEEDTAEVFHTLGKFKRPVRGGGGIIPDILMEYPEITDLEKKAWKKNVWFNYSLECVKKYNIKYPYTITKEIENDFKRYIKDQGIEFTKEEYQKARKKLLFKLRQEIAMNLDGNIGRYKVILSDDDFIKKSVEIMKKYKTVDKMIKYAEKENGR